MRRIEKENQAAGLILAHPHIFRATRAEQRVKLTSPPWKVDYLTTSPPDLAGIAIEHYNIKCLENTESWWGSQTL